MDSAAHDQSGQVKFPTHLQSYQSLVEHIDSLLDGQSTTEKGDKFARFVARLLPQTPLGTSFGTPQLRPVKSHDQGVDLVAEGKDGKSVLYIQAKKRISSAKDIREVIDGFNEFMMVESRASKVKQNSLFELEDEPIAHCLLFTLSNVEGIVKAYEERPSATKSLYDQLKSEQRLHIIDGEDIFAVLRSAFVKVSEVPYQLVVNLAADPSCKNGVYVGVISSDELKRLYRDHNEALFFENVRDFLETV